MAITGATGVIYGIRILEEAKNNCVETHLIVTKWAQKIIEQETDYSIKKVWGLAEYYYEENDMFAPISSGSFKSDGMIIAPCSMKTLSAIATGYTDNLVIRAADVVIKERKKLLVMIRETPLSAIHLENMLKISRIGATVMPPIPAFYTKPETIDDIINQTVGRALDQFGIEIKAFKRWGGQFK